ncbi:MAG: CaiB/BaiF CoA transferase family protein [Acidimicrobiia bacterium]
MSDVDHSAPLRGVRVVELSHMLMGPSCGWFLAQLGAEVIKVEPIGGDKTRRLTGMGAAFFPLFNRSKASISIDIASDEGQEILGRLLASADVFVENFREGTLEGMGLLAGPMHERFPNLIIVGHKGFLTGPDEGKPAMDEVVQMGTGIAFMTGPSGRPLRIGVSANDIMGGLVGVIGVLGALRERDRTGDGSIVRVGLFENAMLLVAQHMVAHELTGKPSLPFPEREFSWPVYDVIEVADGPIFVGVATDGQWRELCDELELPHLLADPRLQNNPDRIAARDTFLDQIRAALAPLTVDQAVKRLDEVGVMVTAIRRPEDVYQMPHALRPGGLSDSVDADGRPFRAPTLPLEIDGVIPIGDGAVPRLGADSARLLTDLGYTPSTITDLTQRGIVALAAQGDPSHA